MRRSFIFLLLAIALISSAAAFEVNDTTVRSNGLNSQFEILYPWIFDTLTIDAAYIYFGEFNQSHPSQVNDNYTISFNFTETDVNYTGLDIPYLSYVDVVKQTLTSNLSDPINVTFKTKTEFCDRITTVRYTSALSAYDANVTSFSCSGQDLELNITTERGGNSIYFDWNISLVNCSESDANKVLKMEIFDEDNPSQHLIADVEIEMEYWVNPSFVYTLYQEMSGNDTYYICLAGQDSVDADVYVKYTTEYGFTHRYYMVNYTLTNESMTNISMYNFNTTTGISDLKLTTRQQENYNYFENVIGKLQRRYPAEGIWRTVQMDESGDYGLLFYNILEENTDYRIIFQDRSNCVLKTTDRMKFVCSSGICDLTYLLDECSSASASPGFTYTYAFNNATGNITVTWSDSLGITTSARVLITKENPTGQVTICDITQTGAAGSVTCSVAGYTGEVLLRIFSTASPERPIVSEWIRLSQPTLGLLIGTGEGALWTAVIMITVAAFGVVISPVAGIITTIFGLIAVFFLGIFTPITTTFIIIACVLGIAIGIKVRQ